MLQDFFIILPENVTIIYLDTCVWRELSKLDEYKKLLREIEHNKSIVFALSYFSLFELSRVDSLLDSIDQFIYSIKEQIWMPLFFDDLIMGEISSYPCQLRMKWLPITVFYDNNNFNFLRNLSQKPEFKRSRDEHLSFGYSQFPSVEERKRNFPSAEEGIYLPEEADWFAWCNAIDYFSRNFPAFLSSFRDNPSSFIARSIPSLYGRSLFLYFKYYVHNQKITNSDFFDLNHISYAPYCDLFITERNASNVLKRIKNEGYYFDTCEIQNVSDFITNLINGKIESILD